MLSGISSFPEFQCAFNSAVQETTGVTPAELQTENLKVQSTSVMGSFLKGK